MKIIFTISFLIFFMGFISCDSVRKSDDKLIKSSNIKVKKSYSTEFCKKDKKLWADSFLGKQAPDFIVEGWVSSKPNFKNKFILIDFWGLHCPQCKRAIPELNKIHKAYKDKLIVIGIATASKSMIESMKSHKIEYYSAFDRKGRLKSLYNVRGIPHIVIIAPNNKVVWEGYPFSREDRLDLKKVAAIINQ